LISCVFGRSTIRKRVTWLICSWEREVKARDEGAQYYWVVSQNRLPMRDSTTWGCKERKSVTSGRFSSLIHRGCLVSVELWSLSHWCRLVFFLFFFYFSFPMIPPPHPSLERQTWLYVVSLFYWFLLQQLMMLRSFKYIYIQCNSAWRDEKEEAFHDLISCSKRRKEIEDPLCYNVTLVLNKRFFS
jgi:hypothetical protein